MEITMKINRFLTILCVFFLSIATAYGQSEVFFLGHQFGVGSRAMSMGGAFTAVSDDYTATYWNPAGLAQIRRMELLGGMSHLIQDNEALVNERGVLDETHATNLNAIGFVFPIPTYRGSLVFAIGYNSVRRFDDGFSYEDKFYAQTDSAYTKSFTELEDGGLNNYVLSGAVEISPNMSIGLSMNIWRGKDNYEWVNSYDSEINKYYFDYNRETWISTNYSAINFKLGALYRLGVLGRLAATISTPVKLTAEEDWEWKRTNFDNYDPDFADYEEVDGDYGSWDYSIKAPYTFTVGAAFTLFPNLIISGDVEYSDWTQLKYTSEPPDGNLSETNRYLKKELRATAEYRVGAEFTVPLLNLQLRGGFMNKQLPLREVVSRSDRRYFTAGAGILLDKQVKLDVAWLKGWWEDENYLSAEIPLVTEDIEIDKFLATIAFRF